MNIEPVTSSNIAGRGFEGGTLRVEFTSGAVYEYSGVPESVFEEWKAAESAGAFFNARIKNAYPYQRVS
jgi:hypothetical protein